MTRAELLKKLASVIEELFEISPENVKPESRLYEDLDLDSIDAVDLIVQLQAMTGRRIQPDEFKSVRTVDDVLTCLEKVLGESASTP